MKLSRRHLASLAVSAAVVYGTETGLIMIVAGQLAMALGSSSDGPASTGLSIGLGTGLSVGLAVVLGPASIPLILVLSRLTERPLVAMARFAGQVAATLKERPALMSVTTSGAVFVVGIADAFAEHGSAVWPVLAIYGILVVCVGGPMLLGQWLAEQLVHTLQARAVRGHARPHTCARVLDTPGNPKYGE